MSEKTKDIILKVAYQEFLEKGFENASVRTIAKLSNLTTGAIYGYFNSKADIFSSIVNEAAIGLYSIMDNSIKIFFEKDIHKQFTNSDNELSCTVFPMIDYIYEHYSIFKLILLKSRGTKYHNYVDRFVKLEIVNTIKFVDYLVQDGRIKNRPSDNVISVLSEHSVLSMFEILTLGLPLKEAKDQIQFISNFYYVGWLNIIDK